jgi:hypothetical protein
MGYVDYSAQTSSWAKRGGIIWIILAMLEQVMFLTLT